MDGRENIGKKGEQNNGGAKQQNAPVSQGNRGAPTHRDVPTGEDLQINAEAQRTNHVAG